MGFVALLGDRAWWVWVGVPIYAGYLAYTTFMGVRGGMGGLMGGGGGVGGEGEGMGGGANGGESKRQKKMEKRAGVGGGQKVMYR